jgi:hypothetical protein
MLGIALTGNPVSQDLAPTFHGTVSSDSVGASPDGILSECGNPNMNKGLTSSYRYVGSARFPDTDNPVYQALSRPGSG